MAVDQSSWGRDWAVAPGEILMEALHERGMSQSELARRMDRPVKTINEIVNGKAAITPETAIQLELSLGVAASFWNNLEASYRAHLAQARAEAELETEASWAQAFPLRDLARHRLVERGATAGGTVAALLRYFGMSSPKAWSNYWLAPAASFRASEAFKSSPHAVAAWLRWGEIIASGRQTSPFSSKRLRRALQEIRPLTRRDPAVVIDRVTALLADAGVALVVVPEFAGTHLSGAARWLSTDKAIIQLSARHKSDDHFWFSLFHEAAHLLTRKREDVVHSEDELEPHKAVTRTADQQVDSSEQKANQTAKDLLIPRKDYAAFVALGAFGEAEVREFARRQDIAPGIVVGRLQREDLVKRSHLNGLKKRIDWMAV